jgi:hypothetical protein
MKKLLIIGLVVLVVLVGSVLWIIRSMGVSDAALLLPADTVAVASLPNLPLTAVRWRQTTLAKIGVEPQMKAFLEQPLNYLTKQKGGEEAAGILWGLKPGRIFAASVNVSATDAAVLIGFQFWGGKTAHDAAVERLRQEIAAGGPAPEVRHETYEGADIASSVHGPVTIYNASHGQWGFISNNLETLKGALDRAAGRRKEGSLAESPRYKQVMGRLVKEPDFLVYVQPQPFVDALLAIGQNFGAQANLQQIEEVRKVEAVGIATKLEGANLRDTIFVLRPTPPNAPSLNHNSIKLTSTNTTLFFDFVADFAQILNAAAHPAAAAALGKSGLQTERLFQLLPEAFGPDCAVSLTWPEGQLKPEGLLAISVKDPAKAKEALQEAATLFPEMTTSEVGGLVYYSIPSLQSSFATPAATLDENHLLIGLDAAEVDRLRQALKAGDTLEKSPTFVPVREAYRSANEVFGYLDTRAIFERGFPFVRQIATVSAALMPGVSAVIDPNKLPETDTIAKHLSPIVYSQTRLPDGYLVDSSGPITLNHALLIGAGAGASFVKPPGQ